jgi:hypothetical protein
MRVESVDRVATLLPGTGSGVLALTEAVLVRTPPPGGAITVTVMPGAAPVPRLATVQVTLVAPGKQAHPLPVAETKVAPAGHVWVTLTLRRGHGVADADR